MNTKSNLKSVLCALCALLALATGAINDTNVAETKSLAATNSNAKSIQPGEKPWEYFKRLQQQTNTAASGEIKKRAENGDAEAQYKMGMVFSDGEGVAKDAPEAAKWYRMAADAGNIDAEFRMGIICRDGIGVKQDHVEAYKWFLLAASELHAEAAQCRGKMTANLTPQMLREAQRRAAAFTPNRPTRKDDPTEIRTLDSRTYKAVRILKVREDGLEVEFKVEGGGIGIATIKLANLPAELQQRYLADAQRAAAEAQKRSERALAMQAYQAGKLKEIPEYEDAENGDTDSQCDLGSRYWSGDGVEQNRTLGFKWWLKAAEHGQAAAQFNVAVCYYDGEAVRENLVEATKWYHRAAAQGVKEAQYNLCLMCLRGLGAPKDPIEAYKWASLAAASGDKEATEIRDKWAATFSSSELAEGQRRATAFVVRMETISNGGNSRAPRPSTSEKQMSSGTGFFITDDGFAVTAYHVVKDARHISLRTVAGTVAAKLIKADPANDLALLKVAGRFEALPIQPSGEVQLGESVLTVGFPNVLLQGLEPKLTEGRISSLSGITDDPRNFQISVPVQPGNSGGPLVNLRGNVVGIVVARLNDMTTLSESGSLPQNVNYAVKSSYALLLLEAVPDVSAKLKKPLSRERKVEDVTKQVEKATVMILAY